MPKPAPLPSPVELGFPPKFSRWYDDQLEAIDRIVTNSRRFTALGMPTGSGKSLTGVAAGMLHPTVQRALYLTSTKGLQDQAGQDFESVGLLDLRGAKNYPCIAVEPGADLAAYRPGYGTLGCDEGPCHAGTWCSKAPDAKKPTERPFCLYYGKVWDARRADLVLSNYAMFFASETYAQGLGPFDLLILDEAHDAKAELEAFLTLELSQDDAHTIGRKLPKADDLAEWKDWANRARSPLGRAIKTMELCGAPRNASEARERRKLKSLLSKLERLAEIDPVQWAIEHDAHRATISPIVISNYAEDHLFRHIKHVVLMSATLTHKTMADLGLSRDRYAFWEAPSRFPLDRRPIISVETTPSVRVDAKMDEDDKVFWLRRIDRIIEPRRRLGWKGIIHTVSYQRMRELMARSDHKDIFIVHDAAGTKEAIRQFKDANGPRILVSPSIVTGYDFPDDECRFQIIGKVPLPDMRGPIMKARGDRDKEYGGYLAMQKLVQACGRGMRGPNDWCETFIVDNHFGDWFIRRNRRHAPRWFMDAIERIEYLPDPLVVAA